MQKIEKNFEEIFHKVLVVLLAISSVALFILGIYIDQQFILKFSPDQQIKPQTLSALFVVKKIFFIISIAFATSTLLALYQKEYLKDFFRRRKNVILNILILFSTILFLLVVTEISLRIVYHDYTTQHGSSPGTVNFNKKYFNLNSEGMRDYEFSLKKEDKIRIVGLGDSFTAGWGVKNASDTYLKVLESKLNSTEKIEIYNFGVGGYGPQQEIDLLKEKALRYNPDIVILGYYTNDFKNFNDTLEWEKEQISIPYLGVFLRTSSYVYYFAENSLNNIYNLVIGTESYEEYQIKIMESELNKKENMRYFEELKNLSLENNFKVMVIVFPTFYNLSDYPFIGLHNLIKSKSEKEGFYYLDLLDSYKNYSEVDLVVSKDDNHPNELAHKIAAESIFVYIKNNKI